MSRYKRAQTLVTHCKVFQCSKDGPYTKGFCQPHYLKFRRYGDPLAGRAVIVWQPVPGEEWKWVPGFEDLYMVSSVGRVWSVPRERTAGGYLSQHPTGGAGSHPGYPSVSFSKDGIRTYWAVHKLMLLAFVGPVPKGMECLHLDDIPTNNFWPGNLRYGTHAENQAMMRAASGAHWQETHDVAKIHASQIGAHGNQPRDDAGKFALDHVDVVVGGPLAQAA